MLPAKTRDESIIIGGKVYEIDLKGSVGKSLLSRIAQRLLKDHVGSLKGIAPRVV
ncbi:hypothetical protein BARBAKC583_0107 [Bartonella bacilliformis KC583]|uniref:Uncharacterized protein n=1 Tax=Bartonella bacilliformis (strain ATCC 35685 / KC583 / Herrer 020/F12,63) TaxID=360095 RepID=A1UR42_BARBK|nr:hypothetical protein BARBAKC583_0107 [Bartonella bacilliformis KC583]